MNFPTDVLACNGRIPPPRQTPMRLVSQCKKKEPLRAKPQRHVEFTVATNGHGAGHGAASLGEDREFERMLDESLNYLRGQLVNAHYRAIDVVSNPVAESKGHCPSEHVLTQQNGSSQHVARWASFCEQLLEKHGESASKDAVMASVPSVDWVLHRVWVAPPESPSPTTPGKRGPRTSVCLTSQLMLELEQAGATDDKRGPLKGGDRIFDKFVLHPDGSRRYLWALVGTALLIYDSVCIPMEIVGLYGGATPTAAIAIFMYWVVDLAVQPLIGFHDRGIVEMSFLKTSRRYLSTWFLLDVIILVIDLFFLVVDDIGYLRAGKGIRMVRNVRVLRLARVGRLHRLAELINSMSSRIFSEYVAMLVKIAQLIILLVAVNHYIACIWYGLGTTNGKETWLTYLDLGDLGSDQKSSSYLYVLSLHWSLTQFSPATNNIAPQNLVERLFAVGVVMFALVYFSSFISSVTNSVNQLKMYGQEKIQERGRIREFISRKPISVELGSRIQMFFDKHYSRVKRPLQEHDIAFFRNLPETLRIRMHEEVFLPLLLDHQPFATFAKVDLDLLIVICHEAMAEKHFIPQEDVFVEHSMSKRVRIVVKGHLDYFIDSAPTKQVTKDTWVSEQALYVHWMHPGKLTAVTSCEFAEIDCEQFHRSVAHYSGVAFRCLQFFANFFATQMEALTDEGYLITDLDIGGQELDSLATRSITFYEKLDQVTAISSANDEPFRLFWLERARSMMRSRRSV